MSSSKKRKKHEARVEEAVEDDESMEVAQPVVVKEKIKKKSDVLLVPSGGIDYGRVKKSSKELWLIRIPPTLDASSLHGLQLTVPEEHGHVDFDVDGKSFDITTYGPENDEAKYVVGLFPSEKENKLMIGKQFSKTLCVSVHNRIPVPKIPHVRALPHVEPKENLTLQYPLVYDTEAYTAAGSDVHKKKKSRTSKSATTTVASSSSSTTQSSSKKQKKK